MSKEGGAMWCTAIDFMITPINVVGRPHLACIDEGISVIAVRENRSIFSDEMPSSFIIAENYLEAAGIVAAKNAGVTVGSVRRPVERTKII
jgi:hypothetical protein